MCQMIERMSSPHSQSNPTSSSHGGGPMVNALNGRHAIVTTPDNSNNTITLNSNSDYHQSFPMSSSDISMYDGDFFQPPNDYLEERPSWSERPESRQSLTSQASPLNQYCQNPPSTPFTALPFSPVDEKKENADTIMADMSAVNEIGESARLRNLLTNSKKSSVDEDSSRSRQMLESRLSQDDSMEISNESGPSSGSKKSLTQTPVSDPSFSSSPQNTLLLKVSIVNRGTALSVV